MKQTIVMKILASAVMLAGCLAAGQRERAAAAQSGSPNPIVVENANQGSDRWQVPWAGFSVADDSRLEIKGYPGSESAAPGGTVALKVTVTPVQHFTVDVFRLGHYHGLGGRLMEHLGPFAGVHQPACGIVADTRMNVCDWTTSVALHIPQTWISGVYVAVLTSENKYQSLVPFWVVEENRRSDMLYISSLNTYEAYNDFPYDPSEATPQVGLPLTGHSLYDFSSAGNKPAVKVAFDRPFSSEYGGPGDGGLYDFEPELISFVEGSGYDVTYDIEAGVDAQPASLLGHKVVVIAGHAEYQTMGSYDALIAARDSGVGLAFISGNELYWQVRYEPNAGVARRVVVGYKLAAPDPVPDPRLRTIRWRDLGRPEQKLIGVQLPENGWMNWGGQPWVPQNADLWAFTGTGLRNGVPVKAEIAGYEIDAYDPAVGLPDGTDYALLSASPFVNYLNQNMTQNSSIYRSRAGNWVWASGSMDWSWGLSPGGSSGGGNNVRHSLQVMTRNIFDRMIHDAPSRL